MAEPVGLALGGLSVVGLVNNCVDCMQLFYLGRHFQKDYSMAITRLTLLEIRLIEWWKALNAAEGNGGPCSIPSKWSDSEDGVKSCLLGIKSRLEDVRQLERRYGLRVTSRIPTNKSQQAVGFLRKGKDVHAASDTTNSPSSLGRRIIWAIQDKKKFDSLLTEIAELIQGLENLSRTLGMEGHRTQTFGSSEENLSGIHSQTFHRDGHVRFPKGYRGVEAPAKLSSSIFHRASTLVQNHLPKSEIQRRPQRLIDEVCPLPRAQSIVRGSSECLNEQEDTILQKTVTDDLAHCAKPSWLAQVNDGTNDKDHNSFIPKSMLCRKDEDAGIDVEDKEGVQSSCTIRASKISVFVQNPPEEEVDNAFEYVGRRRQKSMRKNLEAARQRLLQAQSDLAGAGTASTLKIRILWGLMIVEKESSCYSKADVRQKVEHIGKAMDYSDALARILENHPGLAAGLSPQLKLEQSILTGRMAQLNFKAGLGMDEVWDLKRKAIVGIDAAVEDLTSVDEVKFQGNIRLAEAWRRRFSEIPGSMEG